MIAVVKTIIAFVKATVVIVKTTIAVVKTMIAFIKTTVVLIMLMTGKTGGEIAKTGLGARQHGLETGESAVLIVSMNSVQLTSTDKQIDFR
jgi:hypothetical protein